MAITHKDINLLTQKAQIDGTEKMPVSDMEYITPAQIAGLAPVVHTGTSTPSSSLGKDGDLYVQTSS